MEQLLHIDYSVFDWINHDWQNPWLDAIMPYWREKTTWIPAYLLMLGVLFWQYRRRALFFVLALALTIGLADQLSSQVLKKSVQRLRPCREATLVPPARVLIACGGGYSFTSSHATNHFAIAVFLFLTCGRRWKKWRWLLLVWAATIALGQVYVGVHYPLDILCGALLGSLVGGLGSWAYRRQASWRIAEFYPPIPPVA